MKHCFRVWVLVFWAGGVGFLPSAQAQAQPADPRFSQCLAEVLSRYAMISAELREKELVEVYRRLKNDRHFSAWAQRQSFDDPVEFLRLYDSRIKTGLERFPPIEDPHVFDFTRQRVCTERGACDQSFAQAGTAVDLTRTRHLPFPGSMVSVNQQMNPEYLRQIGDYEKMVLLLKSGDTVVFGDKRFKLGSYVGAGNATHIYELADHPGKLIRIPFMAPSMMTKAAAQTNEPLVTVSRQALLDYVRLAPGATSPELKAVRIFEAGPKGEYAVVEAVQGRYTGEDLVMNVLEYGQSPAGVRAFDQLNEVVPKLSGRKISFNDVTDYPAERERLGEILYGEMNRRVQAGDANEKLLDTMANAYRWFQKVEPGPVYEFTALNQLREQLVGGLGAEHEIIRSLDRLIHVGEFTVRGRQFLFDEKSKVWRMVDWEQYDLKKLNRLAESRGLQTSIYEPKIPKITYKELIEAEKRQGKPTRRLRPVVRPTAAATTGIPSVRPQRLQTPGPRQTTPARNLGKQDEGWKDLSGHRDRPKPKPTRYGGEKPPWDDGY